MWSTDISKHVEAGLHESGLYSQPDNLDGYAGFIVFWVLVLLDLPIIYAAGSQTKPSGIETIKADPPSAGVRGGDEGDHDEPHIHIG